jgi:hypothetical protein
VREPPLALKESLTDMIITGFVGDGAATFLADRMQNV